MSVWNILFALLVAAAVFLLWVMLYDTNRFVVVPYELRDGRIRESIRIVVLADLHYKSYGKENEKLFAAIREQKPDIVVIAGDMVTAGKGRRLRVACGLLEKLLAEYPVYYANGNHEQKLESYEELIPVGEEYEKELEKIGMERLRNGHVALTGTGVTIYGVEIDLEYYERLHTMEMDSDYLERLLGKPDKEQYCILIAHNPDFFPRYAAWGADLVLSGHVHGGVVRIPGGRGLLSPKVSFFPRYDGGLFREGKSTMLLSRGLGSHTIPFRLFNPGELLVVDLKGGEINGNSGEAGNL